MKLQVVTWAIMCGAFYGMWWANKQYKGKGVAWGRPLAALCGVASIAVALLSIAFTCTGVGSSIDIGTMEKRHQRFQYVAYKTFGQELAKRHPGASILLIKRCLITPSEKARKSHEMRIDALKEGLGTKASILATEEATLGSEESDEEMGISRAQKLKIAELALTAKRFDELVKDHADCNLIVSLLGLPENMEEVAEMKLWKMKDDERPAIALSDTSVHRLKPVIEGGLISVILHRKPIPLDPNKPMPPTEPEIFNTMYMLISKETLPEICKEFPKLFPANQN